ncbi:MAG: hypothetical protein HQK70_06355 [Desulfamplus sp.]|nr:hypothetical protein [Desulfamplus sp.]
MITANWEDAIIKEANGLSWDSLQQVFDFIKFIKTQENKQSIIKQHLVDNNIQEELSLLDATSLTHLEEEFFDYKKMYPKEM